VKTFSAWVKIGEGRETVSVVFRTSDGELVHGGKVIAEHGCWSLLKGGIFANFSSSVEIGFQVNCFSFLLFFVSIFLFKYYLIVTGPQIRMSNFVCFIFIHLEPKHKS
jgi:hypothetical protein